MTPLRSHQLALLSLFAALPLAACAAITPIHDIQGSGDASPMIDKQATIQGIVLGTYGDSISGFFVQEEQADWDADPATSEGIFVYDKEKIAQVQPGNVVRVSGKVTEFKGLTQLSFVTSVEVLGAERPMAVPVVLPVATPAMLERYEGMLVRFEEPMTVVETYDLGVYGSVVLAAGGRLWNPTNVAVPGEAASKQSAANNARRIILDDGSNRRNPSPIPFLPAGGTLRSGDTVTGLMAVMTYSFDEYRLYPVAPIAFQPTNPRPAAPPPVGGSLRVASANVLNYFNGDGKGGGFPTERGATTPTEFRRQHAKTMAALLGLQADIVGLMEVENDGFGEESALMMLVRGLNEAAPEGVQYAAVTTDQNLGTDAIRVALIYNAKTVRPAGTAAACNEPPFTGRRPPLAQTFEQIATGQKLTVAVNHFKSKGCGSASGANADQSDGQGCWNAERTESAKTLVRWLASHPTGVQDDDFLIIGDLNAYAMEDPVRALRDAGYVDLLAAHIEGIPYSYVYKGEAGYLDHALASPSLAERVTGAAEWHINADEPRVLDYNEEDRPANLFAPGPWRASDHDPVLVGIDLGPR